MVRSKGRLWLVNAHSFLAPLNGGEPDALPKFDSPEPVGGEELRRNFVASGKWHERWGDCESELALIGVHFDKNMIHKELTAALLTEDESGALGGVEGWRRLEDPFWWEVGRTLL